MNSLTLPGTVGDGPGSYTIQAQLPDVVVIQQNTRVRVGDVNVGNVTKIEVQDWHALVTMRIDGDVHLPANSTAKIAGDAVRASDLVDDGQLAAPLTLVDGGVDRLPASQRAAVRGQNALRLFRL